MITYADAANIIYNDCLPLGITVFPDGRKLRGRVTSECVTIHSKKQQKGKIWEDSFVEVNIFVPDKEEGEADTIRLGEFAKKAKYVFESTGEYDGSSYDYGVFSIGMDYDEVSGCHYVNVRILFKVLNV